jgi:hypothetical protein
LNSRLHAKPLYNSDARPLQLAARGDLDRNDVRMV